MRKWQPHRAYDWRVAQWYLVQKMVAQAGHGPFSQDCCHRYYHCCFLDKLVAFMSHNKFNWNLHSISVMFCILPVSHCCCCHTLEQEVMWHDMAVLSPGERCSSLSFLLMSCGAMHVNLAPLTEAVPPGR